MYIADSARYEKMEYRKSGHSGLKLPILSLGLWQNFGDYDQGGENLYIADSARYEKMEYRKSGHSGLKLPILSLGLWQNFGDYDPIHNQREILRGAHSTWELPISTLRIIMEALLELQRKTSGVFLEKIFKPTVMN